MIQDLYSRKGIGFEVYAHEDGELAAGLLERTLISEAVVRSQVVLHSDNGAAMKSQAMYIKMSEMGVIKSHSRPGVSNDNPYIESFFRTLKYNISWPKQGFASLDEARQWVARFMDWYNNIHKHSKLNYVTPSEHHEGLDGKILAKRKEVLEQQKKARPERWIQGKVRNCEPAPAVCLNPTKLTEATQIKVAA